METKRTFEGAIRLSPPLNRAEQQFLERFADTDDCEDGPSPRCPWRPLETGEGIAWGGDPDAPEPVAWLRYLINHYLKPYAHRSRLAGFGDLGFNHYANGVITVQEEGRDWLIFVLDNDVTVLPSS